MIIRRNPTSLFATNANSLPVWKEIEPNVYVATKKIIKKEENG